MSDLQRLDKFIHVNGYTDSIEMARRALQSGWVKVNGETVRDGARTVLSTDEIVYSRPGGSYASRGGEKLARAIDVFAIQVYGRICLDLGASTGGFTDCLLQNGAALVYAVDVGYGVLDYKLRKDSRVVVMERTNARLITPSQFPQKISFVVSDLSFISFTRVYPAIRNVCGDGIEGVALIKPQFEAKDDELTKGIVTDPKIHTEILHRTIENLILQGIAIHGIDHSPIKGPKGNIEFLLHYYTGSGSEIEVDYSRIVDSAYSFFEKEKK